VSDADTEQGGEHADADDGGNTIRVDVMMTRVSAIVKCGCMDQNPAHMAMVRGDPDNKMKMEPRRRRKVIA
jgi:hypothetical protein